MKISKRDHALLITRSARQGQGLRFSCKDRMFEVNKLFLLWLFACSVLCKAVIGPWAIRENDALNLANQRAHQIGSATNY